VVKDPPPPAIHGPVDPLAEIAAPRRLGAEALYRAHARFVAGFVAQLGVRSPEVDDVVQEVFLVAHRRGGYEEGPARPTTWLAEIALRVVHTRRRTARRRPPGEALDEDRAAATRGGPHEAIEGAEALRRVQRALDELDLDRRALFVLYEIEGESCESIAASLGVPVGTVYSRLHAARKRFQEAYDRLDREPGRIP
jgi:RNA polymerase sigma-70 factor (ECF subfamily)